MRQFFCNSFLIFLFILNTSKCQKSDCKALELKETNLTYLWCNPKLPKDFDSVKTFGYFELNATTGKLSVHGQHRGKVIIDTIKEGSFVNPSEVKYLKLEVPIRFLDKYSLSGFDNVERLSVQVETYKKCSLIPLGKSLKRLIMNGYYRFNFSAHIDKDAFTGMEKLEEIILHELDIIKPLQTKEKRVCDHFFCAVPTLKSMSMGVSYKKAKNCKLSVDGFPYNANLSAYLEQEDTPSLSCSITNHKCHLDDKSFKKKWCGKPDVCHDNFYQVTTSGPSDGWMYYVIPLLLLLLLIVVGVVAYYLYNRSHSGALPVPTDEAAA